MLAETDGGPATIGKSMWSIYEQGVIKSREKLALIVAHQEPNYLQHLVGPSPLATDCLAWTYEQLERGASRLAAILNERGLERGATIATLITNSADWALLTWAAAIGKWTLSLLDPRAVEAARSEELKYLLKISKPAVVVVDSIAGARAVEKTLNLVSIKIKLGICRNLEDLSDPWTTFAELSRMDFPSTALPLDDDLDRTATIMFTSGTSVGHPKGVPRTVRNWLTCAATGFAVPASRNTTACAVTLSFRIAFNNLALGVWQSGGTFILPSPELDGEKLLEAVEKYQVSCIQPVFHHLFPIVGSPSYSPQKMKSVVNIPIGGDVVTTQQLTEWKDYVSDPHYSNYYGLTEGTGIVGWPDNKIPNPVPTLGNIVSPGQVLPGSKLRIVGSEGQTLKRGDRGELHIGGSVITPGYLDNVQPENFYNDEQGRWMKTGDMALIDDAGVLFVLGRTKDIIKRKGVPIPPSSIESCLKEHGNVMAQVVGIPSHEYGEEPYAIVEEVPAGISTDRLMEIVVQLFGAEYALSGVVTLQDLKMTSWPKNSADKVLKRDLKEALEKYLSEHR